MKRHWEKLKDEARVRYHCLAYVENSCTRTPKVRCCTLSYVNPFVRAVAAASVPRSSSRARLRDQ